jgi:flagellar basal body-associated protein FliL
VSRRDAAARHAIISVLVVVLAVVLLLAVAGGLALSSASAPGPAHRPAGSYEGDRFPPVGAHP